MSRGPFLLFWICAPAIAVLAASPLLRADDPSAPTPPPGKKLVYATIGGKRQPLFVQNQLDLSHIVHRVEDDPLDHQKAFSEVNALANKTFISGTGTDWNKSADTRTDFETRAFNPTGPSGRDHPGSKAKFPTTSFAGGRTASAYDKSFATRTADAGQDEAAAAFAAIGSDEQNRTAPIDARTIEKYPAPMANKTFVSDETGHVHHNVGEIGNGTPLSELPDRPLTIDEVRDLINHGFKPNTAEPPPPASKPLNDPDYQPEPLRIEPTESEAPAPRNAKDDDKDDPVPAPGTLADPPENSQPLPKP